MEEKFYTAEQIANYFNVTRGTVYNWKLEGMPSYKFSRVLRFKLDEVIEWLEKRGRELEDREEEVKWAKVWMSWLIG